MGLQPDASGLSDNVLSQTPLPQCDAGRPRVKRCHGRRRLPRELPRQRLEHDLCDAEKLCPCCHHKRVRIGEEITERLDYKPASLFVVEHVRPKYACTKCHAHVAVNPYIVYDATPSRSRDGPQAFLKGYRGYVQADAFGGYDGLYATGRDGGCLLVHARGVSSSSARDSDIRWSLDALAMIRRLYDVERQAKALDGDNRLSLRQRESVPVLQALGEWLRARRASVLPKSSLGAAITYATNQWAALNVYVTDGDLAIDNNVAERALRGVAVGRKNWLFWGSDKGGTTAAVLTSLVATCKRHGIDPWSYLADVLACIPSHPSERIAEFLPDTWAQAQRATS